MLCSKRQWLTVNHYDWHTNNWLGNWLLVCFSFIIQHLAWKLQQRRAKRQVKQIWCKKKRWKKWNIQISPSWNISGIYILENTSTKSINITKSTSNEALLHSIYVTSFILDNVWQPAWKPILKNVCILFNYNICVHFYGRKDYSALSKVHPALLGAVWWAYRCKAPSRHLAQKVVSGTLEPQASLLSAPHTLH